MPTKGRRKAMSFNMSTEQPSGLKLTVLQSGILLEHTLHQHVPQMLDLELQNLTFTLLTLGVALVPFLYSRLYLFCHGNVYSAPLYLSSL